MNGIFIDRLAEVEKRQEQLLALSNKKSEDGNGVFDRYKNPVLTAWLANIIFAGFGGINLYIKNY